MAGGTSGSGSLWFSAAKVWKIEWWLLLVKVLKTITWWSFVMKYDLTCVGVACGGSGGAYVLSPISGRWVCVKPVWKSKILLVTFNFETLTWLCALKIFKTKFTQDLSCQIVLVDHFTIILIYHIKNGADMVWNNQGCALRKILGSPLGTQPCRLGAQKSSLVTPRTIKNYLIN